MCHQFPSDTSLIFPRMGMGPIARFPMRLLCAVKKFLPWGCRTGHQLPFLGLRVPPRDGKPLPGLWVLPVGLMHAASFPPPPPPPASLTRICARPLLPPLREPETEASAAAPGPGSPRPRSPSPGSGSGRVRGSGEGRQPGRAPPRRLRRARYLSS